MTRHAAWLLLIVLVMVRLPSLVQPAGADQDLYAYVGQAITRGGLPYVDAWDQKPPAIHYTYACSAGCGRTRRWCRRPTWSWRWRWRCC